MKLGVKLLNRGATVNSFSYEDTVTLYQGESLNLYFQLFDADQDLRYLAETGATVYVEIARYADYYGTISNIRETQDWSVRRYATQPFSGDLSVWYLPLTTTDTTNMMSSNIRFTLTETSAVSKFLLKQALEVIPKEG